MAFLDGKKPKQTSGGNREREAFNSHVSEAGKKPAMGGEKKPGMNDGGSSTTIEHHGDGSHSVHHADGEHSDHPTTGHMLMALHAKHAEGDGGHLHAHPEGTATTHHVGMDGMVEGPHEHASAEDGANHLSSMMGGGAGEPMGNMMAPDNDMDGM